MVKFIRRQATIDYGCP